MNYENFHNPKVNWHASFYTGSNWAMSVSTASATLSALIQCSVTTRGHGLMGRRDRVWKLSKVGFMFGAAAEQLQGLFDVKWCAWACVCVCVCTHVLQGCLAEPKTQLLALIDFSDREDFPVQGYTPSNRLRSLLAGKGAPISVVKWNLSALVLMRWLGEVTQGPGEVAGTTITASLCGRKKNLIAEGILQTPWNWQLSTTFPWAGLEVCIICMKTLLGAQTKGFLSLFLGKNFAWSLTLAFYFTKAIKQTSKMSSFLSPQLSNTNMCHSFSASRYPCQQRGAFRRNQSVSFALGIRDCSFQDQFFFFLFTLCCPSSSCLVCGPSCSS